MSKFAVVIRHLSNSRPVTTCVIDESKDKNVDNMEHYLESEANDHIRKFKESFPEFRQATWYIDFMETYGYYTPYKTIEIIPE